VNNGNKPIDKIINPVYSNEIKNINLNKRWFKIDLFWPTANNAILEIDNIIVVYMGRPNQVDTDKICQLFGADRALSMIEIHLENDVGKEEALQQVNYYQCKVYNQKFTINTYEVERVFIRPKQHVVDYLCELNGPDNLAKEVSQNKVDFSKRNQFKKMIAYYKIEKSNNNQAIFVLK